MKVLLGGEGEYFTEGAEMIYEWGFINLIEETKIMYGFFFLIFYLGFLSRTFTIHETSGEGEGIYLTPLYHFHPFHRHLAGRLLQRAHLCT